MLSIELLRYFFTVNMQKISLIASKMKTTFNNKEEIQLFKNIIIAKYALHKIFLQKKLLFYQ
ncbi:hypothetical protein AT248_03070 [Bartonella henselae]|nr:hypothetical protein BhenCHDE101_03885 [Bartonella henselae]PNM38437.1 hypothetical protein AL470_003155 [Bartonella henselae str. Houston-1]OLL37713.1 hypothetical protein AT237_03060 [Bartonella henselae]OLL38920.1 hypothetical protein AT244_01105 [Bartonella henselae]OLL44036.1 hypothetical protein AT242_01295 [Bartonella henselae]